MAPLEDAVRHQILDPGPVWVPNWVFGVNELRLVGLGGGVRRRILSQKES